MLSVEIITMLSVGTITILEKFASYHSDNKVTQFSNIACNKLWNWAKSLIFIKMHVIQYYGKTKAEIDELIIEG